MNKTLKLTVFLAIIAALATGLLAAVNSITAPIIAANDASSQNAELALLYPDASTFESVEFTDADGFVQEAYKVDDSAYVFKVDSRGYDSVLSFLVGYDNDGSNSKFKMLSNNDTPGFGQKLSEDSYQEAMTGKATSDAVEMVSGATTTSTAVADGITAAVKVFNELTGSTATPSAPAEPETHVEILSKEDVNGSTKYLVEAEGFSTDYNIIAVVVSADGIVEEVSFDKFVDSDPEGKNADKPEFLDLFKGIDLTSQEVDVDTSTGSTWTSNAVLNAVKAVKEDLAGGGAATQPEEDSTVTVKSVTDDGTSKVYVVETEGFLGDKNVVSIKISAEGLIEVVAIEEFNDSQDEGAPARSEDFLGKFTGLDVSSEIDVDTSTGATHSSNSILEAVKKAAAEFGGQ